MIVSEVCPFSSRSKKVILRLEGAEDLVLFKREFMRLSLEQGDELPREVYDRLIREVLIPRARHRVLHLLERGDRTEADLFRKLREGGYPSAVAEDAIGYAASYGYVDDERYAANYIRFHQDKRSRRRIVHDLMGRGIASDIIDRAMESEYESRESDQIRELLARRHFDPDRADRRERDRQIRFLLGRGYSWSDISGVLGSFE